PWPPTSTSAIEGYQVEIAEQEKMGLWHHSLLGKEHPKRKARHLMTQAGEFATIDEAGVRVNAKIDEDPASVQEVCVDGEWNSLEITAVGNTLIQRINGKVFAVLVDRDQELRTDKGWLALQDHGKGCQVAFRNIRVRKLDF
ncbi:MAG: DUF1080 domain-containing protein, partial [Verrucomicrobiota bacterium]